MQIKKIILLILCIIIGGVFIFNLALIISLFELNVYNSINLTGINGLLGLLFYKLICNIKSIKNIGKGKLKIIFLIILFIVIFIFGFYYSMLTSYIPIDYEPDYIARNSTDKRLSSLLINELQAKITPEDNPNNPKIIFEKYGKPNEVITEKFHPFLFQNSNLSEQVIKIRNYKYDNFNIVTYILNTRREVFVKQVFDMNSPQFVHNYIGMNRGDIKEILGEQDLYEEPNYLGYRLNNRVISFYFNDNDRVISIQIPFIYRNRFLTN